MFFINSKDRYANFLLKVKDDQVVAVSDRFWKEKGYRYYPVLLPRVVAGIFKAFAWLKFEKEGLFNSIHVSLVCHVQGNGEVFVKGVPRNGFVPQEIYDFVIQAHEMSVEDRIVEFFEDFAENDREISSAFAEHFSDLSALKKALAETFNNLSLVIPLSNITKIDISLLKTTISDELED